VCVEAAPQQEPLRTALSAPRNHTTGSRRPHIRNQVRREVVGRDGWQCNYVSPEGRRCTARGFLQFDHKHRWADGGLDTPENLRVLCGPHNRLLALKRSA
jgi:hypothetical protein